MPIGGVCCAIVAAVRESGTGGEMFISRWRKVLTKVASESSHNENKS